MAKITMIAAVGKNNELGNDNKLLWHLPEDLKFFKEQTIGKKVILGRKTLESLKKLLPGRKHLVLTHNNLEESEWLQVFNNTDDLIEYLKGIDEEVMVIGGAKIYQEFLPYATKLIITEIEEKAPADAYFPKINKEDWQKEVLCTHSYNNIDYKHTIYTRKK